MRICACPTPYPVRASGGKVWCSNCLGERDGMALVDRAAEAVEGVEMAPEKEEMAWQPMETAPRDGPILAWVDGSVSIVCWNGQWNAMAGGDFAFTESGGHFTQFFSEPTHWMPLPEPPK